MIQQAIIFAFLAMLFWGIEDFLALRSARRMGDFASLAIIMVIGAVIFTPFVIKDFPLLLSKQIWVVLAIVALIHFAEGLLYFESFKRGKLAVIDVIFEFELPVTVALSLIFFKESISSLQFILIGFVFIGIILIATKQFKHLKVRLERGVIVALIAAVSFALVNFSSAFSVRLASPMLTVWFVWVSNAILCLAFIIYYHRGKAFCRECWKFKWSVLIMSIVASAAWVFYFFAIRKNELGIITAITEAYPVIAISLAILIYKERVGWHQYVGIGLALIAAIMLAFV